MKRRLVILTEIIAPYRVPVFNALANQPGVDLHVIFLAENDPGLRQWLVYKDDIRFSYEVLPSWRQRIAKFNVLLNWGLRPALQRARPEVMLCGGYNYLASWKSLWWAERKNIPFLLWVESTTKDLRCGYPLVESLKSKLVRCSDAFVVPGRSSFEYLRSYGAPEEAIFTAPNAVDTEFFAQRADEVRRDPPLHRSARQLPRRYFLFVGRLVAEKGVLDLLQAYAALPVELRFEIGLVIVGDGPDRADLQQRAAAITPGAVQFPGFLQRDELAEYYALADAFVFPTHSDPWGLVVNEAMACGLPVIASNVAGCASDLVEEAWNGRLVKPQDITHLTSAMAELAKNSDLRSLMGQRSRARIRKYSPEVCAAGIAAAVLSCGRAAHA